MESSKNETTPSPCEKTILEVSNAPPVYQSIKELPMYFGRFGGCFVAETLVSAHEELAAQYMEATKDPLFRQELENLGKHYVGRPTALYHAQNLSTYLNGGQIWLKREDLCHTGAHKINNALGQALIAKRLGKERIICETGAGQHGVATATACALLNLQCTVYMGSIDMKRQELNVFRMRILGATVIPVESGSKTLKDAVNESIRDWVTNVNTTHYIIGSAIGPHPFPTIVRDFQSVIGRETMHQFKQQCHDKEHPDYVIACVGGGSNAIGIFHEFVPYSDVQLIGVEAGGSGIETGKHSASLNGGSIGVLHGTKTFLLQDKNGQIIETHSVSAGLDYAGVGPEHAMLHETGRVKYEIVNDKEALEGFRLLCQKEGIIPALESSHAIYYGIKLAKQLDKSKNIIICLSGRGDKDMVQVAEMLKM